MKRLFKLIVFISLLIGFLYIENNYIVIDKIKITTSKIENDITILHLSDLHGKRIENPFSSLKNKIDKSKYDIVLISGDIMVEKEKPSLKYIDYLKEIFKNKKVYYVDGNHEASHYQFYNAFTNKMAENNFINISNNTKQISINNNQIYLAGLQDPLFYKETTDKIMKNRIKSIDKETNKFKILLSHRSEYTPLYNESNFDLILTGHAHGGVVGIPFSKGNLYSSSEGYFPKYTKGLIQKTYISRGLGNSRFNFRLFNHPQISFITLTKK